MKAHELSVYWSTAELNHIPEGITGVSGELSDGNNTYVFDEVPGKPGYYLTSQSFIASAGKTYRLIVTHESFTDTAYAVMSGVSPLETADIVSYNGYYRYRHQQGQLPSMTEVYYDWSENTAYCLEAGKSSASEVFYDLNNIDIGKLFPPDKEVIVFPKPTILVRRKYSLSSEHERFIRALLLETEWRGGLFDVEQGNVPTNFGNGVIGWFAACAVVSDTVVFN
jgi:hypothetical protein